MKQSLDYYLQLRYPMEIVKSMGGGYFAQIPDLPGCTSEGDTPGEAVANLEEAKRAWIEVCLEDSQEIPLPHEPVEEYSGKFLVRLPKSLHRELSMKAQRESISLNQYVVHLLSLALGRVRMEERERVIDVDAIASAVHDRMNFWCTQMHRQLSAVSWLSGQPADQGLLVNVPDFPQRHGVKTTRPSQLWTQFKRPEDPEQESVASSAAAA